MDFQFGAIPMVSDISTLWTFSAIRPPAAIALSSIRPDADVLPNTSINNWWP
tara:strand:- start:38 stop:193 length:156 start_codon:yes stop_codon:yes gene_type:complete